MAHYMKSLCSKFESYTIGTWQSLCNFRFTSFHYEQIKQKKTGLNQPNSNPYNDRTLIYIEFSEREKTSSFSEKFYLNLEIVI